MPTTTAIERALADMRQGRAVLVVAPSRAAVARMVAQAAEQLRPGEIARHANGGERVTGTSRGWIAFAIYANVIHGGSGRGLSIDRVYVDHGELVEQLAPTMVCSPDGLSITHC